MDNSIFIEIYSDHELYKAGGVVTLSVESVIIYSVFKYCAPVNLKLYLVFSPNCERPGALSTIIKDDRVVVKQINDFPWQVLSCVFPIAKCDDTVITGMCAVARHICKYRTSLQCFSEHEEGLLGFRHSCLQAPNEASVWTKFCEIDIIKTTKEIIKGEHKEKFPINVARFENHLKKPVKIHNVYKIARNRGSKKKEKQEIETHSDVVKSVPLKIHPFGEEEDQKTKIRVSKIRKWKSTSDEAALISSSTPIDQLNVEHKFAEGPFLTLADLVLYPSFYIISKYYAKQFSDNMINTSQWIDRLNHIEGIKKITDVCDIIIKSNIIKPFTTSSIMTPPVSDVSLYKCDQKRHNPKKRVFTKEESIEQALSTLIDGMEISTQDNGENNKIDWSCVPSGANPKAGHLPDKRMERKCQQLENLALAVLQVANKGDLIVDFCSGSGHLGILVAYLLPECTVVLLENKEQSLTRARDRVCEMALKNVCFFQCNLDFFIGKFDIGLALHACGIATDLVLDKCLKVNAKFIICPCCYGSLHSTDRLHYPRSLSFSPVPLDQYMCIGHAADQTHSDHPLAVRGARCMAIIDSDRARLAEESGYKVTLSRLKPQSCTPKNNLLIGIPNKVF